MWAMNLGKPVNVPQLNETMAIELGANLLGETIIFTIGAGVLVYEYVRQSKKEDIKEEKGIQEKIQLSNTINELHFQIERQDAMLREMTRIVADLGKEFISLKFCLVEITIIVCFTESRTWLPKKPKIFDDSSSNSVKEISSEIEINKPSNDGNILNPYPNHGVVFKSLNYIQNELFYRSENIPEERKEGIVTQSLIYLENYQ